MQPEVIQRLKGHGFTEYEAKAYAALVDLGRGTAREIHEISGVPQGRFYTVLEALAGRGFIEVQEGVPTFFKAQDAAEVFGSIKKDYGSSIDRLVDELKEVQMETKPSSPYWSVNGIWSIRSERGIQSRLKTMVRNARKDILMISKDSQVLLSMADDLKTARKRVNLTILTADKDSFSGSGIMVHAIGRDLSGMYEEMVQISTDYKDPAWDTELFAIVDGMAMVTVGRRSGKRSATVIEMPPICFMIRRLIELLEPSIRN